MTLQSIFCFLCAFTLAQTPYYGPNEPPHFSQPLANTYDYTEVQINVYDQPELGGLKIVDVSFNGSSLPLQAPDLHGFRGGGSFKMKLGSYPLVWKASRDSSSWPRTVQFKQTVQVGKRDDWLQITIRGDQAQVL